MTMEVESVDGQGCLQDELLMEKLAKIVASSQPPTAYQASYY